MPCLTALAIASGRRERNNGDRLTHLVDGAVRRAGRLGAWATRWESRPRRIPAPRRLPPRPTRTRTSCPLAAPDVFVEILAPDGFPPAKEIEDLVQRAARSVGVRPMAYRRPVNGPLDALRWYARGIPSVWIGGRELEVRGRRASFEPRTFKGGHVVPTFESIRAALVFAAERSTFRLPRTSFDRGRRGYRSWLRRHAPESLRRNLFEKLARTTHSSLEGEPEWPHEVGFLVRKVARQALESELSVEESRIAETLEKAIRAAIEVVERALAAAERASHGLRSNEEAVSFLADILEEELPASPDELVARARELAPSVRPLMDLERAVPLDDSCEYACRNEAREAFRAALPRGPAAALARAREVMDGAVAFSIERHEQVDEQGDPLECGDYDAIRSHLGIAPAPPTAAEQRQKQCEEAVGAAWRAALRESKSEKRASRRALEAAAPFDMPPEGKPRSGE